MTTDSIAAFNQATIEKIRKALAYLSAAEVAMESTSDAVSTLNIFRLDAAFEAMRDARTYARQSRKRIN
jgi:hypothetical protein